MIFTVENAKLKLTKRKRVPKDPEESLRKACGTNSAGISFDNIRGIDA